MNRVDSEIKTQGIRSTNLPIVLTNFIGRVREMAEITQRLASSRLVTLTGAAGCGKSRLALRMAAEAGGRYTNGVHWIELARLTDPALVPQTVARALRLAEQPDHSSLEKLLDALQGKQLLMVLDNCEHLRSACAQLVETLLTETDVHILAASREPLSVMGEMLYPVAPLSLPPRTLSADDADEILQFDAIQLFVDRARAILPTFLLTQDNARAVANICHRLDGIPLAIELASARLNVLTTEQIAARLDNLFALLPSITHLAYSQHDSLRAAIDWSHDLLSEPEQVLLRRLSVFAGGCSLTTAGTVCAGEGIEREQVLDLLSSLVDKSLLVADTLQRGEARYSLLETIRQYGQENLIASGEQSVLYDRHLGCFLHLAEETAPKLRGEYQQLWLDWLEGEYDNLRAALAWSLESGRLEAGLRMGIALYQFWTIRDYVEEGLAWMERLLLAGTDESVSAVVRANALAYASFLAGFRGNSEAQIAYGSKAASLAEASGDEGKPALAWALVGQAYAARATGDYQTEFTLSQRIIQLYREIEDSHLLGVGLSTYSFTAMSLGKFDTARTMLDEALPLLRETGDRYRIAMALNFSGDLARCEQNYKEAQRAYEESISLLRGLNAVRDLASVLHNLGHTCLHRDDAERAHALFDESLTIQQSQQNTPGVAECLIGFAALAVTKDLPAAGACLLSAAVAIGGERVATTWAATRMEYEHYLGAARASLSERSFREEQAAGQTFSLVQAVDYARDIARNVTATQKALRTLDELTPREREVAVLIARGRSNGEIAAELVVSKRTVESHVSKILSKLDITNRAQIVRWGIETGLVKVNDTDRS
jgi:predicted ATPase/DNA-binding CsgD family transcriptional regulator